MVSANTCGYQVILAGDLNGVFNPSQDHIPRHVSSTPDTILMQFLASQGLVDIYRAVHPYDHSLNSMTWINPADSLSGSRIDYILATPDLASHAAFSQVISVPGLATDHQLLFTSFQTGMLTKCVWQSTLQRFTKAQNIWDFKAMAQENWMSFTQVSERQAELELPGATWGNLASFLQQESIDAIWEVFLKVLNTTATKVIPQCRVGGEPHGPLRRKSLLIMGFALLVGSCIVLQPSGLQMLGKLHSAAGQLKQVHSDLLTVTSTPELQPVLLEARAATLPSLPLITSSVTPDWQHFKKEVRKLWSLLRLARSTQQALTKAEWICTCVQH